MNRLALVALALLVTGMSHQGVGPCRPGDKRCMPTAPLLSILKGGPTSSQMASGALQTAKGANVTDSRASSVYCADALGVLHLLSNNQPCTEASGLRAEGQATNVVLQSGDVTQAAWAQHNTSSAAATGVPDPFGGTAAQTVTDTATNADHYLDQALTIASGTAEAQAFVKYGNVQCVNLEFGSNGDYAVFDVQHGTVSSTGGTGSPTAAIQAVANGFYRLTHSATISANDILYVIFNPTCAANHDPTYAGGSGTFTIKGVQVETGSIATSYIPTTTTVVTRAGDTSTVSGVAMNAAHAWSISADVTKAGFLASGADGMFVNLEASANDRIQFYTWSDGTPECDYWNGTTDFTATTPAGRLAVGVKAHVSCWFDGTQIHLCINGGCTTTTAAASLLSSSYTAYLGSYYTGAQYLNGEESSVCVDASTRCQ